MKYEVTVENTKSGKAKKVTVEAADKFEAMAKVETMRWAAVGAQRTVEDILQSQAKATTMLWIGTEPCYRAETNAHITAFFQRNACRLIERVAAELGIDLQAEMRKSEAVERRFTRIGASLIPSGRQCDL